MNNQSPDHIGLIEVNEADFTLAVTQEEAAWNMLCDRLRRDPATSEEDDTCSLRAAWKAMLAFARHRLSSLKPRWQPISNHSGYEAVIVCRDADPQRAAIRAFRGFDGKWWALLPDSQSDRLRFTPTHFQPDLGLPGDAALSSSPSKVGKGDGLNAAAEEYAYNPDSPWTKPGIGGATGVDPEEAFKAGARWQAALRPSPGAEELREALGKVSPELFTCLPTRLAQMLRDGASAQVPKPNNLDRCDFEADATAILLALNYARQLIEAPHG